MTLPTPKLGPRPSDKDKYSKAFGNIDCVEIAPLEALCEKLHKCFSVWLELKHCKRLKLSY